MTRLRYAGAAALAVLPIGLEWTPGTTAAQHSARVFLVLAAVAFAYASGSERAPGVTRLGAGALIVAAALAAAERAVPALVCVLLALGLAVPVFGRTDAAR